MAVRRRSFYVIGSTAFVPTPYAKGLWLKTDTSVVKVACPACKQEIGIPCQNPRTGKFVSWTHYDRRKAAGKLVERKKTADYVIYM